MNLDFLLDEEKMERNNYELESHIVPRTREEFLKEYRTNPGLQMLVSYKSNGAIESVMMCLMESTELAEFTLREKYENYNLGRNMFFDTFREFLKKVFIRPIEIKKKLKLDCSEVSKMLELDG